MIAATPAATPAAMPDTQFARVFQAAEAHTVTPATVAWMTAADAVAERLAALPAASRRERRAMAGRTVIRRLRATRSQ